MNPIKKPAPRINSINRPFFKGCNEGILMLQHCRAPSCGRYIYFPRVCCPYCGSGDLDWKQASGEGEIVTYTTIYRPNHPSFSPDVPYYFVAVRLKEGPIIYSRLIEKPSTNHGLIGRSVSAVFLPHGVDQKLVFFNVNAVHH